MLQYILGNIRVLHSLQSLIFFFIFYFRKILPALTVRKLPESVSWFHIYILLNGNELYQNVHLVNLILYAIAVTPVSEWVSQSVSQWLIVSDLEIANASLSFATYNRNGTVFQKNSLHFLLEYLYQVYKWWLSSELFKFLDCFWEKVLHLGTFEIHKICILDAGRGQIEEETNTNLGWCLSTNSWKSLR